MLESRALSLTWRAATQPLFLHRISVVRVYLHIAATAQDPAGRDLGQVDTNSASTKSNPSTQYVKDTH